MCCPFLCKLTTQSIETYGKLNLVGMCSHPINANRLRCQSKKWAKMGTLEDLFQNDCFLKKTLRINLQNHYRRFKQLESTFWVQKAFDKICGFADFRATIILSTLPRLFLAHLKELSYIWIVNIFKKFVGLAKTKKVLHCIQYFEIGNVLIGSKNILNM